MHNLEPRIPQNSSTNITFGSFRWCSEGKRLFENGVPPRGLALVETRSTAKGVLINTYRSAGPVKTGSF